MAGSKGHGVVRWVLAAFRQRRTWLLLALTVAVCAILFSFQGPRCCVYGWLRFEPTYRWLPASYWRAVLLDQLRLAVAPGGPPTEFMPLARYEWQRYYDVNWSLAAQGRHLRQRDPALLPLIRCLVDDPDPQARFQAISMITLLDNAEASEFVPRLVELLNSPDFLSRWSAIHTLSRIGPAAADALPTLRSLFAREPRDELKVQFAFAIRQIDPSDQESFEYLVTLLRNGRNAETKNTSLVVTTANYIRLLEPCPKEALPILIELARDDDPSIAQSAFNALLRIDPELAKREGLLEK